MFIKPRIIGEDSKERSDKLEQIAYGLECFVIGLLMTHEKKTEREARAVVDDLVRKISLG